MSEKLPDKVFKIGDVVRFARSGRPKQQSFIGTLWRVVEHVHPLSGKTLVKCEPMEDQRDKARVFFTGRLDLVPSNRRRKDGDRV